MKTLHLLRKLISFIYGLFLIVFVIFILVVLYTTLSGNEFSDKLTFTNYEISNTFQIKILLCVYTVITSAYIYTLYLFKKLVYDFSPKNIFSSLQIFYLSRIGRLIIGITISEVITNFLLKLFYKNSFEVGMESGRLFENYFFIIAVGLFFIFLSEIFKIAKNQKEENELTI